MKFLEEIIVWICNLFSFLCCQITILTNPAKFFLPFAEFYGPQWKFDGGLLFQLSWNHFQQFEDWIKYQINIQWKCWWRSCYIKYCEYSVLLNRTKIFAREEPKEINMCCDVIWVKVMSSHFLFLKEKLFKSMFIYY